MKKHPPWHPTYTLTPATASALMQIESARTAIEHTPLPPAVQEELRHCARVRSTHYSTRIEGNRLTLEEAMQVIEGTRTSFHGRERDVGEVQNYWNALLRVEEWAAKNKPLTENLVKRLHALVEYGARDLGAYYNALAVHPHHNYYEGRAEADLTGWVEYFIRILADVFTAAKEEAQRLGGEDEQIEPEALRRLDPRGRAVLSLFARTERITSADVARTLGLSQRMARNLLRDWVEDGWLEIADPSRRGRAYGLSAGYRQYIGNLSAMGEGSS